MTAHKHAAVMLQYAQDAAETDTPWRRWEFRTGASAWEVLANNPLWDNHVQYRRRPRAILVNGIEVPEPLREAPPDGTTIFLASASHANFANCRGYYSTDVYSPRLLERGLVHLTREAAAIHGMAMVGLRHSGETGE